MKNIYTLWHRNSTLRICPTTTKNVYSVVIMNDDKNELILSICNFKQKKSDSRLFLKQKLVIWGEHVIRITLGRSLLCSCFPAPFCCRRHMLPHAYPRSLCHGQGDAEETARGALLMQHSWPHTLGVSSEDETVEPLVPKVGEKRC